MTNMEKPRRAELCRDSNDSRQAQSKTERDTPSLVRPGKGEEKSGRAKLCSDSKEPTHTLSTVGVGEPRFQGYSVKLSLR